MSICNSRAEADLLLDDRASAGRAVVRWYEWGDMGCECVDGCVGMAVQGELGVSGDGGKDW